MANFQKNQHTLAQTTISSVLSVFMAQRGFGYKKIARDSGLSKRKVESIIKGKREGKPKDFVAICGVLGRDCWIACWDLLCVKNDE